VSGAPFAVLLGTLCASVTLLAPARAQAQVIETEGQYKPTPQHFAFELKFGPYRPDVDSEFPAQSNQHPYQDFFGTGRKLMTTMEFQWEIIRHVGTAALGLGLGYFKETGNNLKGDGSGGATADTSSLRLLPFSLSAIYRFDLAYERLRIPLVPYGKLGFDYVYWTVTNGNGEVPKDSRGGTGQGGTLGWHATIGLSLVLDVFDQGAANQFDQEMGINHTHLFFEFTHLDASGLGASNRLHVGDSTWNAGIMFEF
jgi:hypothetical protein